MLLPAALLAPPAAIAASCSAASGTQRVALLELYTSEGCDSRPPSERWINALQARGFGADRVLPLAFHVDYWDYIGWKDPFAQARFCKHQRFAHARISNRTVYTLQLMPAGKDYRRGLSLESLRADVDAINRRTPVAPVQLQLHIGPGGVEVNGNVTATTPAAQEFLALSESRLSNQMTAGENRGKRLEHDHVARDLAGPFAAGALRHRLAINTNWKHKDLAVSAFVQDAASGELLQALALPYCG